MNELLCDFCSAPSPAWRYPARTFLAYCAPPIAGESVGDWAACDSCHALIENDDPGALAQRSLDELIAKDPEAANCRGELFHSLMDLHEQFHTNRCGPAQPIALTT